MKKSFAFFFCFWLFLSFAACTKEGKDTSGLDLRYQLSGEPATLDPQICADFPGEVVIGALFEGLTRLDEAGKAYPGVAESWESNASHTTFTFFLREDAVWSDFSEEETPVPVTAADFVFAFQRAVDPATQSPHASKFFCIQNAEQIYAGQLEPAALGVSAVGMHTLVIELTYAYPNFPDLLATTPFMPCNQAFFLSTNGRYGLERKHLLTNGPFSFSGYYAWEHDLSISLTRSANYAGETKVLPQSLLFSIGVTAENPLTALENQDSHLAQIPASLISAAEDAGMEVLAQNSATVGLCFHFSDELMQHREIRQAFVQTLNRSALEKNLPSYTTVANDIISLEMTLNGQNYRNAVGSDLCKKEDAGAVARAQNVLDSMDYESMPSVSVLCEEQEEVKKLVNEMIVAWNAAMGNFFNMTPLPAAELRARVLSGDYQIALLPVSPENTSPLSLLRQFGSEYRENPAALASSQYDSLLKTAAREGMPSAYLALEEYLHDEYVFYPIYYESRFYAMAPGIDGIVISPYQTGIDFIHASSSVRNSEAGGNVSFDNDK